MFDFTKGLTMEVRDGVTVSRGVTVVGSDAPSDYHIAPRTENPSSIGGSTTTTAAAPPQVSVPPPQTAAIGESPAAASAMPVKKKKRGRPRKYAPDGLVTSTALSPTPISSSAPPPRVIDFSAAKRDKVRPASSMTKAKFEVENLGNGKYFVAKFDLIVILYCSFCWNRRSLRALREYIEDVGPRPKK